MFDIQHWALDNRSTWDLDFTIPRLNEIYNGCNSLDQSNDKIQEILHEERYTRFDRLVGIKTTEGDVCGFAIVRIYTQDPNQNDLAIVKSFAVSPKYSLMHYPSVARVLVDWIIDYTYKTHKRHYNILFITAGKTTKSNENHAAIQKAIQSLNLRASEWAAPTNHTVKSPIKTTRNIFRYNAEWGDKRPDKRWAIYLMASDRFASDPDEPDSHSSDVEEVPPPTNRQTREHIANSQTQHGIKRKREADVFETMSRDDVSLREYLDDSGDSEEMKSRLMDKYNNIIKLKQHRKKLMTMTMKQREDEHHKFLDEIQKKKEELDVEKDTGVLNYQNRAEMNNQAYQHICEDLQNLRETLVEIMDGTSEEFLTYPTTQEDFKCDHKDMTTDGFKLKKSQEEVAYLRRKLEEQTKRYKDDNFSRCDNSHVDNSRHMSSNLDTGMSPFGRHATTETPNERGRTTPIMEEEELSSTMHDKDGERPELPADKETPQNVKESFNNKQQAGYLNEKGEKAKKPDGHSPRNTSKDPFIGSQVKSWAYAKDKKK
jgi:hypothetical protein